MTEATWFGIALFFIAILSQVLTGLFGGRTKRLEDTVANLTATCTRLTIQMALVLQRLGMHDEGDDDKPRPRRENRWPR